MVQRRVLLLTFFLLTAMIVWTLPAESRHYPGRAPNRPILINNQIEIQFESDVDVARLGKRSTSLSLGIPTLDNTLAKYNMQMAEAMFSWRKGEDALVGTHDMSRFYIISLPENDNILDVIDELEKNPYIRSASAVWATPLYESIPDDPGLGSQWGMSKINATDVWDIEKGSDTAIVAVVDAGVLYTHPDLEDHIWVNPGEDLDGDGVVFDEGDINGEDDDGNGVIDDIIGYDFFTGISGTPWPGEDAFLADYDPKDFNGHGTHIAGVVAAVTNNTTDVAGLAGGWGGGRGPDRGAQIMCLRVGGSYEDPEDPDVEVGFVNLANCAQGIDYAASMGACAINCSWGGGSNPSTALTTALSKCNQNGVVVVHSAGNDDELSIYGDYLDELFLGDPSYEVALSVAATTSADVKADFSNYGPYVDVSAPGVSIYSTYSDHYVISTEWLNGTSMSAPFVCGLAALIKSHMPDYTKVEIDALIKDNANYIDDVPGNESYAGCLGSGRINAYASMADLPVADFTAGPELVGPAPLEVTFTDISPNSPTSWDWDFGDEYSDDEQHPVHTYQEYGMFAVALTVDEPRGTVTEVKKNLVMVTADTIQFDSIQVPTSETDQEVILSAYLSNRFIDRSITVPMQIKKNGETVNYHTIMLDSVSLVGCRTEHFEYNVISPYDPSNSKYGIKLIANTTTGSEYLQPGEGAVLKMHLTLKGDKAGNGTIFTFDTVTISTKTLELGSIYGQYVPVFKLGKIFVQDILCGDLDSDGFINILDIVYLINYKYKGGPEPEPLWVADVNLDEDINILDVVYLINYKYKGGPEPCDPPK